MKRVLITTGIFAPDAGGPASYARAIGTHLSARGIEVTILTYSAVRSHPGDADAPYRVCRVWRRIPWGIRHTVFFIRAFLHARKADGILALNAATAGFTTAVAARLARKPLIVRIPGDYAWEIAVQTGRTFMLIDDFQKAQKRGRIARLDRMQKFTCRRAKAVIAVSKYMAELIEGWGVPQEKIHLIYNGVDLPVSDLSKEEARRELGLQGNIIITCGRLVPWKGFRMLIKILPQLLQVNQFFRLVIVGDGPDMAMLQNVARTLGLERKIVFAGRVDALKLSRYLASADMFVLNTGYEGFSHQVLEAMAAGVPVITTTSGGNRELIVQGENGLMVRYNDEFNITEAIKAVWRQPELRERMVANGRHTVSAFSVEKMYERTDALLEEIFSKPS